MKTKDFYTHEECYMAMKSFKSWEQRMREIKLTEMMEKDLENMKKISNE